MQASKPFTQQIIRAISGRNSPIYSAGIADPYANVQATGDAVLNIWNARINESLHEHDDLRIFVFIRNMARLEFTMFEIEATRYVPANYNWRVNRNGNFEGYDGRTGSHCFTWQSSGSQFTVFHHVPPSAYRFRITRAPGVIEEYHVLDFVGFMDDWIESVPYPLNG